MVCGDYHKHHSKEGINMNEVEKVGLLKFRKKHMKDTLSEIFDTLESGGDFDKFTVTIQLNGKAVALEMHADLWSRLETFIDETIEEDME
jgi:hypothetical protein